MKNISFIIALIFLFSCKNEVKSNLVEDNTTFSLYGFIHEENTYLNFYLKQQIDSSLNSKSLIKNKEAQLYDSLTVTYLKYLDKVYNELLNKINIEQRADYNGMLSNKKTVTNFFFDKNNYSKNGVEFTANMDSYKEQVVLLVKDENLRIRISGIIDAHDITNRYGQRVKYLNHFYKDMPLIGVLSHLRNKKRSVLEFENEFLKNLSIKN